MFNRNKTKFVIIISYYLIITMAKRAFMQKWQLLTNKILNINMRKFFVKHYVWSVLLYGCEI